MPGAAAYRETGPPPGFAQAVECFWSSEAPAPGAPQRHHVLPDGCMDILFDFRAEMREPVTIVGTMSRALVVETGGATDLFGIRFRPGGLPALLRLDAAELRDASLDLAAIAGPLARELWERLAEASPSARPGIAARALPPSPVDRLVAHCAARIAASAGTLPIAELERSTGAGARRIERAFARHVGVGPKVFARIARFRALVAAAQAGEGGWADLAAAAGYADQPHMTREFRHLSGLSPGEWLASAAAVGFVQDAGRAAA
jgi:AraC-like DNA-binding protein